jgi:hypothetical protein
MAKSHWGTRRSVQIDPEVSVRAPQQARIQKGSCTVELSERPDFTGRDRGRHSRVHADFFRAPRLVGLRGREVAARRQGSVAGSISSMGLRASIARLRFTDTRRLESTPRGEPEKRGIAPLHGQEEEEEECCWKNAA